MSQKLFSKTYRFFAGLLILAMLLIALPSPVSAASSGLSIKIVAVDKNNQIVVEAANFPKNQSWTVRVGPYYSFRGDAVTVNTFTSTNGGTFRFIVVLPDVVEDVDWISVRLDSDQKYVAYNAFFNADRGDAYTTGLQPSETPTGTSTPAPSTLACSLTSVTVTAPNPMSARYDFDAVWTIKNTGSKDWETNLLDYKYWSGTKMNNYADLYDLPTRVAKGESITLRVDMTAPSSAGTYTSTWALVDGNTVYCYLPVTITVK
ncbi:MAG: hypothetical protein CVU46_17890 [Chloroflexi bacterium HGW-Chloroflexi-8]|jgi:hypothetical protein|nr:MAG: hypothetical protein CVU46_17890 [Chloroflexi bacterium HGW-Chloroflexi-8]